MPVERPRGGVHRQMTEIAHFEKLARAKLQDSGYRAAR
jgi:hypothetical protein